MPSPLAHAAMGYVLYKIWLARGGDGPQRVTLASPLLIVTVGLSLLPDVDLLPGILMGNLGRFHNNVTNSLVFGLVVALVVGGLVWLRKGRFVQWFGIALLSYEVHVIMDLLTVGRGLKILWPFSSERLDVPVKVFFGLHWSEGWVSMQHVWTLVTELGFVIFLGLTVRLVSRRKPR